jgi:hypothetical protein
MKALIPIVCTLAAIGLLYFYAYDEYVIVQELRVVEREYDIALERAADIETVKAQKMAKFNSINAADLFRLDTIVRDRPQPLLMTLYIEDLIDQYNLDVSALNISGSGTASNQNSEEGTPTTSGATPLQHSISFTSSYDDMIGFMRAIETNLELADITSLNVNSTEEGDYSVALTFQTYVKNN